MELRTFSKEEYGQEYENTILEQWKTCVEAANGITEKRNNANSVFITINTALLAIITFSLDYKSILLSIVGIVICVLWFFTINSYKKLNNVKYEIVNELEKSLPTAPFAYEWKKLNTEKKYIYLTNLEKVLPWLFAGLYSISILWPILKTLILCSCIKGGMA